MTPKRSLSARRTWLGATSNLVPYLTPDELPEDGICRPLFIPNDTAWLAIVSGALTELTKPWNWEKFGTMTVQQCVEASQGIVAQYYNEICSGCELPEGGSVIRFNGAYEYEQLVDGAWVEPQGDYELPPLPEREEPTEEERRCLAAANAANVLKLLYEDATDSYNLDVDPAVAFTTFIGTQSTVILVAIGFLSFGTGVILYGLWTLFYQAMEFLTEDVWDTEFEDKLKCVLYGVSQDDSGVVTFNYRNLTDQLAFNIDLGDPSLGELRLYAQVLYILRIIGADGLNYAGATTAITDPDCDACRTWGFEWDMAEDQRDFSIATASCWGALGVYTPSVGLQARVNIHCVGVGRATFMNVGRGMPAANYRHIEIDFTFNWGVWTVATPTVPFRVQLANEVLLELNYPDNFSGTIVWDGNLNTAGENLQFGFRFDGSDVMSFNNAGPAATGSATFSRLLMCGDGVSPLDEGLGCDY